MTEQALLYVFAVPGILAAFGAAIWLDSWRRNRSLDAEIAAYRARRHTSDSANARAEAAARVASPYPVDAAALAPLHLSRLRHRRARVVGLRMPALRPRPRPSEVTPGE